MTRLSLCLIARDEAEMLPGCLASVRDVVDEMVVGDTGSMDDTPLLARAAGAHVVSIPWRDDFAAARNGVLAHATGDWILALDADERLAPEAGRVIREALAQGDFDGAFLPLYNASRADASAEDVINGKARVLEPVLLPRLFRRTPDLAWHGIVHEELRGWLLVPGRRLKVLSAPVIHLGELPEIREARGKAHRNIDLLQARLAMEPDWVSGYEYLSNELLRRGQADAANDVVEAGWEVLSRVVTGGGIPFVNFAWRRAGMQVRRGGFDDALATVAQARVWGADHPNLDHVQAWILRTRASLLRDPDPAELEQALGLLQRCVKTRGRLFTEEPAPGVFGVASLQLAGEICGMLGRASEALRYFDAILSAEPRDAAARTGRVEALLDLRDPGRALAEAEPLLQEDVVDAWFLAAAAARAVGAWEHGALLAQEALKRRERGLLLPRRMFRLG